ncbi:MAG: hypothetical protein HY331_13275 [Chloroflexi bacterium]|nr:hypothetical protein [Chloroflexota bacterium]
MTTKERLHRLVEELPESELHAALRFLEYLRNVGCDPVLRALHQAPEDDEPATPEEDQEAAEAWREYLRGEARPWERVREELARD